MSNPNARKLSVSGIMRDEGKDFAPLPAELLRTTDPNDGVENARRAAELEAAAANPETLLNWHTAPAELVVRVMKVTERRRIPGPFPMTLKELVAWLDQHRSAEDQPAEGTSQAECPMCGGTGGWPGVAGWVVCKPCGGTGKTTAGGTDETEA